MNNLNAPGKLDAPSGVGSSRLVRNHPTLRIQKCKAVRIASHMSAKEMRDALAPLFEKIPNDHRVISNAKLTHSRRRKTLHANPAPEPPATLATEMAGGCWVERLVERSRSAAARTGRLRRRLSQAGGLILHWPLTAVSTGCRWLAGHDARQTSNHNL